MQDLALMVHQDAIMIIESTNPNYSPVVNWLSIFCSCNIESTWRNHDNETAPNCTSLIRDSFGVIYFQISRNSYFGISLYAILKPIITISTSWVYWMISNHLFWILPNTYVLECLLCPKKHETSEWNGKKRDIHTCLWIFFPFHCAKHADFLEAQNDWWSLNESLSYI